MAILYWAAKNSLRGTDVKSFTQPEKVAELQNHEI